MFEFGNMIILGSMARRREWPDPKIGVLTIDAPFLTCPHSGTLHQIG
jgi:hypothetical protein